MQIVKLSTKGRLTLPSAIRKRLGMQAGEKLSVQYNSDGSVTLRRYHADESDRLAGSLSAYAAKEPATQADMDRAMRQRAASRFGKE